MTLNLEETERQARALLDSRIDSVRALVKARQRVSDLQTELAEAEREDARLYSTALRDGWSAEELRKLGISEAGKPVRAKRRPKSAAAGSAGSNGSDSGSN